MRTVTAFVPYRIKRVSPVRGTDSTIRPPQTRDDRMVKNMKIPFTVDFIINSSTEQFNEFNMNLNEEQRNLCRDIRRRGKNKVGNLANQSSAYFSNFYFQIAAQNCRRRKTDQIADLEEEVVLVRSRKTTLIMEHENLLMKHQEWCVKLSNLERHVLDGLGLGEENQLAVTADGAVQII